MDIKYETIKKQTVTEKQRANLQPPKHGTPGGFAGTTDKEKVREYARQGGLASGARRKRIKRLTDAAKWLLEMDALNDDDVQEMLKKFGFEDATNAEALMVVALRKAFRGDVEALKFVRDTGGESPSNRVELAGDPTAPIATMDLRNLSEAELLKLAEERSGADELPETEEPID